MSGLLRILVVAAVLAGGPALAGGKSLPPGERIDLNSAPVVELMRLPGIGEKKAQAIVTLRQRRPFRRIEDVLAVKGIGAGWLRKARANVTVGPASPTRGSAAAPVPARKR